MAMEITEIRIFPKEGQDKKLKAYVTVTFSSVFVVRNIKLIQGSNGLFIAMPSRKMKYPCQKCFHKNEAGSKFCSQCGLSIPMNRAQDNHFDAKAEHRDIAHPITQKFRTYIEKSILEEYSKFHGVQRNDSTTSSDGAVYERNA